MDFDSIPVSLIAPIRSEQVLLEGFRACKSEEEKTKFVESTRASEFARLMNHENLSTDELDFIGNVRISPSSAV